MSRDLHRWRLWTAVGLAMILAVVAGSLVNIPDSVPLAGGDKAHHLLAYGALMYWWGMLQPRHRLGWAVGLAGLGLLLEWLQSLTGYRFMEWRDAVANGVGICLALILLTTPASSLLGRLDRKLANSGHAGRA